MVAKTALPAKRGALKAQCLADRATVAEMARRAESQLQECRDKEMAWQIQVQQAEQIRQQEHAEALRELQKRQREIGAALSRRAMR